ncbi:DoxX-like protein [Winogradskyella wandonensis]|uniref:DoxX-like protein n=1 Tax=Winogradskyella wandonensis TaxID=1442586 RepID=A0A4R1KSA7_9FLAO|nr:DoxX family protein [Winogradskyella wandonensis]TCK67904.1 DoxX-like protein [Winogradskyella wandonensis]
MLTKKIIYWVATAVLCCIMLYSAQLYFRNTEMVEGYFKSMNYPTYFVIPLAVLKVLGVIMILWRKSQWLTEWAYAGFFFDLVLATAAHYYAGDGIIGFSLYALIALFPSYFLGKYIRD